MLVDVDIELIQRGGVGTETVGQLPTAIADGRLERLGELRPRVPVGVDGGPQRLDQVIRPGCVHRVYPDPVGVRRVALDVATE